MKKISTLNTVDYSKLSKIGFHSPLWGVGINDGYGYAAIKLIQAWQRLKIPVWAFEDDAPVIFNMGQPIFYERVEGKLNIGYTAWESTEISESWIQNMNKMDEIWTMCDEMRDRFERVLDVPVFTLHHGIDRTEWPIVKRQSNGPIKLLHVGGHAPRKGAELVYECFSDIYADSEDVVLDMKGYKFNFKSASKNVNLLTETYSHEDMIKLYYAHHAMIYPCKGEGFGLVPFQAASSGMATAVTNWSGPADYMERCFPIKYNGLDDSVYEPHLGQWAVPDTHDIERWMKLFVDHFSIMSSVAHARANMNETYWTWDNMAKIAVERMIENLN